MSGFHTATLCTDCDSPVVALSTGHGTRCPRCGQVKTYPLLTTDALDTQLDGVLARQILLDMALRSDGDARLLCELARRLLDRTGKLTGEAREESAPSSDPWERALANVAGDVARREAVPAEGAVAALVADVVAAGGALPYPGTKAEASAAPAVSNPQPEDRDLILEVIQDLGRRMSQVGAQQLAELGQQSAALWRLLERADDYLGWHVRDARVGRAP